MGRTILLFGGTGQIGYELQSTLSPLGEVTAPGRTSVDLSSPPEIRNAIETLSPDIVVNAAAYTAVDDAETNVGEASAVNARAPEVMAEATASTGSWFVHYSTDYVFDGEKQSPYVETDETNPINVYGRTKRQGELAVLEQAEKCLILRTSWVYGDRRSNFLLSMLRLAENNETLTIVDDQTGTPTSAVWIAEATATSLRRLFSFDRPEERGGLYHLAASGQTSWYSFAKSIYATFGRSDVDVEPISSAEYPTAASRPPYTVLDSTKARTTFNLRIPTWTEQLANVHERAQNGGVAA